MHRHVDHVFVEINKLIQPHDENRKTILDYIADVQDEAVKFEQFWDPVKETEKYEQNHKYVQQLDAVILDYLIMEKKLKASGDTLKEIQNAGHIEDLEGAFIRKSTEKQGSLNKEDVKKDERYISFRKAIYDIHKAEDFFTKVDDDEIEVSQAERDIHDPCSKEVIEHPVRNRKCGHVYDKATIIHYIKSSRKNMCPVAGCRSTVAENDLERDLEMEIYIKRKLKNQSATQTTEIDDAIDLSDED
ncbi:E3 SUMO-protein ligase [Acrasis kona]|uniref:E3 SUMO-protein ligase n=1 Tax=Acrasis kona TaxID=1008807 RepID=A0AAW2ZBB8_9EUKA